MSPSAFIPFCEFGGKMAAMSINKEPFEVPICNSFQAVILNDQLCYEVDLNKFTIKDNTEKELKVGLILMMDYNEDRQVTFEKDHKKMDNDSFGNQIVEEDKIDHGIIYVNAIGKYRSKIHNVSISVV